MAVVIDNGSGRLKAGFSGFAHPDVVFPTIVGHLTVEDSSRLRHHREFTGSLDFKYPIEHGTTIGDFNAMEVIWEHTFKTKLQVSSKNWPVIATVNPTTSKAQMEKMCELFFERFSVPKINISTTGLVAMSNTGRLTGVLVDSGESVTYAMPIINGVVPRNSLAYSNFAGRRLTSHLISLLTVDLSDSIVKQEIAREIKERACFISPFAFPTCLFPVARKVVYQLSDNSQLVIGEERFKCPEALFDPSLAGQSQPGIHELVRSAIDKAHQGDEAVMQQLYDNIVLCGGSTNFAGLTKRLTAELQRIVRAKVQVHVITPADGDYLAWQGASRSFETLSPRDWLKKVEYEENGISKTFRRTCLEI